MKKSAYQIKSMSYKGESLDYIQMPDTCVALYKNAANQVLLVKQYRPIFDAYFLELPGGSHEKDETLEETVIREFREETGLVPIKANFVITIILSIGSSTEKAHIFYVDQLEPNKVYKPEEGIELHWINLSAVPELIKNRQIVDAKTIIALQTLGA